jgi:hypothetical protein
MPLAEDCAEPLTIVTDNGPALRHVRTRHHAPETKGVVERFNQSLKYEHL